MGINLSIFSNISKPEICFQCGNYFCDEVLYCYDNTHCSLECVERTIQYMEKLESHIDIHREVARLSPIPAPIEESMLRFDAVDLVS